MAQTIFAFFRSGWQAVRLFAFPLGKILAVCLACFLAYRTVIAASLWLFPLPINLLERDYSTLNLDRDGRLLRITLSPSGAYRLRLPLEKISPDAQRGFLLYEDRYFYFHDGVNLPALLQAGVTNLIHGHVRRGGSTLTMQIAKLMEPKPRTLWAKCAEVARAWQLESHYSKQHLLELYLNLVPMGGNIEGVGAAAYLYFGKPADALSWAETGLLIGLPKSPRRFRPDRHPQAAAAQRNRVLARIAGPARIAPEIVQSARDAPLPDHRHRNPRECPTLLQRAHAAGPEFIRHYTIDPWLQAFCEARLLRASLKARSAGVRQGAVMVVDNRSMQVLAYVGAPQFGGADPGSQINGAAILRSPGSLLKPFVYARALETGRITPRSMVFDIERNYDGYHPANYDRQYHGPLPAIEALAFSLNNPAVNLEFEMGPDGLAAWLKHTRLFGSRLAKSDPGLSLVLGAMPLSLEELVRLYSIFPNQGRLRQLCFFTEQLGEPNRGRPVLSPQASYLIAQMLAELMRPDLPQSWEFTPSRGKIAYKTGTSFGLRDAWAIGFNPEYTVGVWFGNVDATCSSALVGSRMAAPLMAEVFNELTRYHDTWFKPPPGLAKRRLCAVSGEPAGPDCGRVVEDDFIPGVSGMQPCSVHHRIWIDRDTGEEACPACMTKPAERYASRVVESWPPEVAAFLRAKGKATPAWPPHNPQCSAFQAGAKIKIKSPMPGGFYAVTRALPGKRQKIPLTVNSQRAATPIYWYLDGALIGSATPDETVYLTPSPGWHKILAVNTFGQSDRVTIRVLR